MGTPNGNKQFSGQGLTLIYDGDCPLCSAYVSRMRLAESVGSLELLDARQRPELVQQLQRNGYDLDEGMLVMVGERYYHGAAAIHVLALMSSRSGWFNRLNYRVFRSPKWSSAVYPLLVAGRRLLLRILRRKPIGTEPEN